MKKNLFLPLILILLAAKCFSQEEESVYPWRKLFFEQTRYVLTGETEIEEVKPLKKLSSQGAFIFSRLVWDSSILNFERGFDIVWSEYRGVIQYSKKVSVSSVIESAAGAGTEAGTGTENELEEEPFLDGEKLLELLDGKDEHAVIEGTDEEPAEIYHSDRQGELRKFSYGGENFSLYTLNGFTKLVKTSEQNVTRRTFDSDWKLIKKEVFNNPDSSDLFKLLSQTVFFYSPDGFVVKTEFEDFSESKKVITEYGLNNKKTAETTGHFEIIPGKDEEEIKTYLEDSVKNWAYDTDGRVISAETLKFTYEKNKKGKTVKKQDSTKYTYSYTQKSENPDVYYYEGEDLRIKTVYNTDSHWIETLYFDDGFSIVTEFDDGYKVQETFYINGQEMRRNRFEKAR